MSNILKVVIPSFICFAGIFIYICSFSLEVFLSLSALGSLIVAQALFLFRRTKVAQYGESNFVERSQEDEYTDLHDATFEYQMSSASLDELNFPKESQSDDEPKSQEKERPSEPEDVVPQKTEDETPVSVVSNLSPKDAEEAPFKKTHFEEESEETQKEDDDKAFSKSYVFDESLEKIIEEAKSLLSRNKYDEALKIVDNLLEERNYTFNNISHIINLIKLKGDCEFYLKNYEKASKIWLLLFNKNYLKPSHSLFFTILEDIIEKCGKHKSSLYFLLILLSQYRQSENLEKIDETYYKLEEVHLENEDYSHLTQTYQSHIAVKEKLGDIAGQLPLLDDLGKLYYDQGNLEDSRTCYEQRIILEELSKKEDLSPVE